MRDPDQSRPYERPRPRPRFLAVGDPVFVPIPAWGWYAGTVSGVLPGDRYKVHVHDKTTSVFYFEGHREHIRSVKEHAYLEASRILMA